VINSDNTAGFALATDMVIRADTVSSPTTGDFIH
jgi:hypothetical protein